VVVIADGREWYDGPVPFPDDGSVRQVVATLQPTG
jgi:hypothetical protein